ncbi:hypothetical protein [Liquorilactobacillus mali]|uniref:hypothetical protein n=1 Tax=Liquorilactobacillus mali TaxID=1618 RepID=UPI002952A155|nr:hypothetical protein [Liquorilactobacillus mali]MDV7758771.1 hypothetical protein [Liquorilactobacillus mali]
MGNIFSSWLIEVIIGILAITVLSFFAGIKPISEEKVEELEFLIRTRSITFSWVGLMSVLVFSVFDNFFTPKFVSVSKWDPLFYIGISLILYFISYVINKRKYS